MRSQFVNRFSFIKPAYKPESAWHKHSPFAFWLLSKLKPKTLVELGVHNGFSFFVFCQAGKLYRGKKMFYAVDHWQGDNHAGYFEDDVYLKFIEHQQKYKYTSGVIRDSFENALSHFSNQSIDVLHIDGRHFYDDVKKDFENWKPKLKQDAIVLFHDTQVVERDFGVHVFWKELVEQYPLTFEFNFGHGLGIICLGTGSTLPNAVYNLLMLDVKRVNEVQQMYKLLGTQIHYEYLLDEYKVSYTSE